MYKKSRACIRKHTIDFYGEKVMKVNKIDKIRKQKYLVYKKSNIYTKKIFIIKRKFYLIYVRIRISQNYFF